MLTLEESKLASNILAAIKLLVVCVNDLLVGRVICPGLLGQANGVGAFKMTIANRTRFTVNAGRALAHAGTLPRIEMTHGSWNF